MGHKPKALEDGSKENIQWVEEEWDKWRPGAKVGCGKRWGKAIGIEALDKDGTKTKAHVEQLISCWKSAKTITGSGWGDQVKRDGKWVSLICTRFSSYNLAVEIHLHPVCVSYLSFPLEYASVSYRSRYPLMLE